MATPPAQRKPLPSTLLMFLAVLVALNALCGLWMFVAAHAFHMSGQSTHVLLPTRGVDLVGMNHLVRKLHTYAFFTEKTWPIYRYPAPVMFLYAFFYHLPAQLEVFLWCVKLLFAGGALLVVRAMVKRGASPWQSALFMAVTLVLSYPIYFEIRQSNTEPFILLLLCCALLSMLHGRHNLAAGLIGAAAALKLYPAVFMLLLLPRRKYTPFVVCLMVAVALTVAGLRFLTPSIPFSWHGVGAGLANYRSETLGVLPLVFGYDHSLFVWLKFPSRLSRSVSPDHALKLYFLAAGLIAAGLYLVRLRKLPFINQVCCLSLAMLFLPPSSYDYTLIHLFMPLSLLIALRLELQTGSRELTAMFICYAFLLAAETEFFVHGLEVNGLLKGAAAVLLAALTLLKPLPSSFDAPMGLGTTGETAA